MCIVSLVMLHCCLLENFVHVFVTQICNAAFPYILFQHFEFPIVSMFDNFKNKCLVDALSCRNMPLIQVKLSPSYRNNDL